MLSPKSYLLSYEEIFRLAQILVRHGVSKIRLTGGEPLVRKDVTMLISGLAQLDGLKTLAMTTNGWLVNRKIAELKAAGLHHLNISLDTLRAERFREITRRDAFRPTMQGIEAALAHGFEPLKINCVVMRGVNDDELVDFVAWTAQQPIEVRFIEYMPFGGNRWADTRFMAFEEMKQRIERHFSLKKLPVEPNETAKRYRVSGFVGTVGFITSMTEAFCASCNRIRLTADGHLKMCLHGASEVNLRDMMRAGATDAEIAAMIGAAVQRKKAEHAGLYQLVDQENRPMILIGG